MNAVAQSAVNDVAYARLDAFNDRMLRPFSSPLVDAVGLKAGARVLDAGCGTGRLALDIAAAVQPGGTVVGVDVSSDAIAVAESSAAGRNLPADFIVGDASSVALAAGSFDVVVSRFAAMLYNDPSAAHSHLRSLLRPGGRYAATVWQELARNQWHASPLRAVQRFVDLGPGSSDTEPGPFALADPERITNILESAGFVDVTVTGLEVDVWVGDDLDEAIQFFEADAGTSLRSFVDDATIDRITSSLREDLAPHLGDRGVVLPAAAWLIVAHNPHAGGTR